MAARVWHAYQCLPRDKEGNAPEKKPLEDSVVLSNGTLKKLITGLKHQPRYETMIKVAKALQCDVNWLVTGEGTAPSASRPIPEWPYHTEVPPIPRRAGHVPKNAASKLGGRVPSDKGRTDNKGK
jgi:DNA-binding Xre family transcriptional regulator